MNRISIPFEALVSVCVLVAGASGALAEEQTKTDEASTRAHTSKTPDVRGDELKLKIEKGCFVIVPIPISNPTLGTALVVGAAYFYGQTEEQKQTQPASVTGGGVMYSTNDSYAAVIGQENYWGGDTWRFVGAIGYADMKLEVTAPDLGDSGTTADWLLDGGFLYAQISRRIAHNWYLGVFGRTVDFAQTFEIPDLDSPDFDLSSEAQSTGLGVSVEHDSRDMPTNAYSGNIFGVKALFNEPTFGSDNQYESYSANFSSYHELSDQLVLAWELEGCLRSGKPPLWDACKVGLRGFAVTDYLGKSSVIGQAEARWRLNKRWGLVGFAGVGFLEKGFSQAGEQESIPSYGIGIRFMVLQSKRINIRVDYARSNDSDAFILSVGEAF